MPSKAFESPTKNVELQRVASFFFLFRAKYTCCIDIFVIFKIYVDIYYRTWYCVGETSADIPQSYRNYGGKQNEELFEKNRHHPHVPCHVRIHHQLFRRSAEQLFRQFWQHLLQPEQLRRKRACSRSQSNHIHQQIPRRRHRQQR